MDTVDSPTRAEGTPAVSALPAATSRFIDLLASTRDLSPRARECDWTLQQVTAHLAMTARYLAETVQTGATTASNVVEIHEHLDRQMADITEDDPDKLGALLQDAVEEFLEACATRPSTHSLDWARCPTTPEGLAGLMVCELVLHGYDVAFALGRPWPIDALDACLSLGGLAPLMGLLVDPERARGHSAGYGIELDDGPALTMRFIDGALALEAAGGPVDVTISADPVAYLMVASGRLSRYEAIALGRLRAGGRRPELAIAFFDLFISS